MTGFSPVKTSKTVRAAAPVVASSKTTNTTR
jgi:hypothetical protein